MRISDWSSRVLCRSAVDGARGVGNGVQAGLGSPPQDDLGGRRPFMGDEVPKLGLEKPADLPPDAIGQHRLGGAPETSSKAPDDGRVIIGKAPRQARSEEHTSELQSLMRISYAVFCLKKKNRIHTNKQHTQAKHTKKKHTKITKS